MKNLLKKHRASLMQLIVAFVIVTAIALIWVGLLDIAEYGTTPCDIDCKYDHTIRQIDQLTTRCMDNGDGDYEFCLNIALLVIGD